MCCSCIEACFFLFMCVCLALVPVIPPTPSPYAQPSFSATLFTGPFCFKRCIHLTPGTQRPAVSSVCAQEPPYLLCCRICFCLRLYKHTSFVIFHVSLGRKRIWNHPGFCSKNDSALCPHGVKS